MRQVRFGLPSLLLSGLVGVVLGWLGHEQWRLVSERPPVIAQAPVAGVSREASRTHHVERAPARVGTSVGTRATRDGAWDTLDEVASLYDNGRFTDALDHLLVTDRLSRSDVERRERLRWLERVLDAIERQLTAERRVTAIDPVLESVVLAMPDQWRYFYQLGEFRVQHGNDNGAARVLSQIENHPDYGPDARRLLAQIDQRKTDQVTGTVTIPLIRVGGQFLVPCRIGDRQVNLLLDTGAAMTVITPELAHQSGLPVGTEERYFATAGGVIQAPVVVADHFVVGNAVVGAGVVIRQLSVGLIDIPFSPRLSAQGLLGMNVLGRFRFRLDQQTPALHLQPINESSQTTR